MRVRLRFTKLGKIRWTSHRDVARMWERALRRTSLPVARTAGFNPRPKVSFGLALPTGHESVAEFLDVDWYVTRERSRDEVLPWAHISAGLHDDFLWQDWEDALAGAVVEDCRWTPCYDCGACTGFGLEHVVASAVPPAGGSQGTGQDLPHADRPMGHGVPVAIGPRR